MTPNLQTEILINDRWRITPARMAERLTDGRFTRFQHIQYLDRIISEAIARGGARIVISMPPRHGKSWLNSLYTPAWFLSLWPERNVILASYEATFASTWGRSVRNFLCEHQTTLGIRLADDSQAADRWNTIQGGGMLTAGIGGPITGRGGHLIIIDDPVKNWEEAASELIRQKHIDWFNSTLYTRAEPNASIVVLMTRWHERDLAGYLLKEHQDKWTEIRLPALAEENDPLGRRIGVALCPERYSTDSLNQIQQAIGSRMFAALYQQRPSPEHGNILQRPWFRFYTVLPTRFDEVIQSWDLSFKETRTSDYCVGQCWGRIGSQKYLIDQIRERMDFTKTIQAIRSFSQKHPEARTILVEEKANGPAVIAALKKEITGIIPYNPKDSKIARVNSISPQIESGCVFLPDPKTHPWVEALVEEAITFPHARFDDAIDSMAQALLRFSSHPFDDFDLSHLSITRQSPFLGRPGFS